MTTRKGTIISVQIGGTEYTGSGEFDYSLGQTVSVPAGSVVRFPGPITITGVIDKHGGFEELVRAAMLAPPEPLLIRLTKCPACGFGAMIPLDHECRDPFHGVQP